MLRRYCTRLYANRNVESPDGVFFRVLQMLCRATARGSTPPRCPRRLKLFARKPRANQFIVQILDRGCWVWRPASFNCNSPSSSDSHCPLPVFLYWACANRFVVAPVRFHPRPKRVCELCDFQEDERHPVVNAKITEAVKDGFNACVRSQRIRSRSRRQNTVERLT
jgi:hypothetical protein